MSKYKGFILLYRDIKDHWIWDEKPFDKKSAWIDLIMSANHNGNKVMMGMEVIDVKRGEFITSQEKLSNRWGWSITKVRDFLALLDNEKMILKKTDSKKTTIEIVNYEVYQKLETAKKLEKNCIKTDEKLEKNTNNELGIKVESIKNQDGLIFPEWLDQKLFNDFKSMRLKLKKPVTDRAETMLINKLAALKEKGYEPSKVIEQSILHCWQDFFELKDQPVKDVDIFKLSNCINPNNLDEVILERGIIVPKYRCHFVDSKWSEK